MTKYTIQHRPVKIAAYNAGSKPVNDVCTILSKEGYTPLFYKWIYSNNLFGKIAREMYQRIYLSKIKNTLKDGDLVLIQFPFVFKYLKNLYKIIVAKHVIIYVLVHDIDVLRGTGNSNWAKNFPPHPTRIIVHTEQMKQYLVNIGFKGYDIRILTSFDYLTNEEIKNPRKKSKEVVFAGNLAKTPFLENISPANLGLTINCYGKQVDNLASGLIYKSAFKPENVSIIEGSWGLVWDGDSVDSCSGPMGNYQKYNSPHKLSLYIVAHLPIIIWEQAAMAKYVKEKGLGICVSSLKEVAGIIDNMTDEEYNRILENVKRESKSLRNGEHLRMCIK